jgi:hypothetical protein
MPAATPLPDSNFSPTEPAVSWQAPDEPSSLSSCSRPKPPRSSRRTNSPRWKPKPTSLSPNSRTFRRPPAVAQDPRFGGRKFVRSSSFRSSTATAELGGSETAVGSAPEASRTKTDPENVQPASRTLPSSLGGAAGAALSHLVQVTDHRTRDLTSGCRASISADHDAPRAPRSDACLGQSGRRSTPILTARSRCASHTRRCV